MLSISRTHNRTIALDARPEPTPDISPFRSFRVPEVGQYVIVKHDYERADYEFTSRGPYPDTCMMEGMHPSDFHPLSSAWQWWWFGLLNEASRRQIPQAELLIRWARITESGRALTDRHSWNWPYSGEPNLYIDYVQGLNLNSSNGPMQQKSLTMGGNLLHVVGQDGMYWIVETLNISAPPPPLGEFWKTPWLIHWATSSTTTRYADGTWKVVDWAWLNWNGVPYGVPFLCIGRNGRNLIKKENCKPIANGAEFSPYR
jgi:hypothetical protein